MANPAAHSVSPARPLAAITGMTPTRFDTRAAVATSAMVAAATSKRPAPDACHSTCQAKNTARFTITPTTAAVMAVSGGVGVPPPRVWAAKGPPAREKRHHGRRVGKVRPHPRAGSPPRRAGAGMGTGGGGIFLPDDGRLRRNRYRKGGGGRGGQRPNEAPVRGPPKRLVAKRAPPVAPGPVEHVRLPRRLHAIKY